jgi:hypothetical protein
LSAPIKRLGVFASLWSRWPVSTVTMLLDVESAFQRAYFFCRLRDIGVLPRPNATG